MQGIEAKASYIGHEVAFKRDILGVRHPVEHGRVTDWNTMMVILEHAFTQQLRLDPTLHPVLLAECPLNPKRNREMAREIMFEKPYSPAVYLQQTAVLSLNASGQTTGLVIESGDDVTHAVPIYEGFAIRKSVQMMDVGGDGVTRALQRLLKVEGLKFESPTRFDIVQDLKEKLCYVALDHESE